MEKIFHLTWNSFSLSWFPGVPCETACLASVSSEPHMLIHWPSYKWPLGTNTLSFHPYVASQKPADTQSHCLPGNGREDHSHGGPKYVCFKQLRKQLVARWETSRRCWKLAEEQKSALKGCMYIKMHWSINRDPVKTERIAEGGYTNQIFFLLEEAARLGLD